MLTGFVLPGGSATEQLKQAVLAEESGWDGVFVWEAAYGVDAWSLLAAMAAFVPNDSTRESISSGHCGTAG